jgi:hypothetical protein
MPTKSVDAVAGATILASDLNNVRSDFAEIRKTADKTLSNVAVLEDDNHLTFSVGANESWLIIIFIQFSSSAVADFKCDFTVPSGGAFRWSSYEGSNHLGGTGTFTLAGNGVGARLERVMWGTVRTASTTGTVDFRWAQNTGEVSNTVVYAESLLLARHIA